MKKASIIIGIIVLIAAIAGGAWWFLNKTDEPSENMGGSGSLFGENKIEQEAGDGTGEQGFESTDTDTGLQDGIGDGTPPLLYQLHKEAVAGMTPFMKKVDDTEQIAVRYIEKGLGHVYETDLENLKETRISNETRTKIYDAVWGNNGHGVIIRYLDSQEKNIRSFLIKLSGTANEAVTTEYEESEGLFLPENIVGISPSTYNPDKIFYILNKDWSSAGIVYNIDNGKMSQVFQSEMTEWLPQWYGKNNIALTTKPSALVPGYLYDLNIDTERLVKIMGGVNGLTTLISPDGKNILYSESKRGGFILQIYNTENKSMKLMPFNTLPEKCVWSKNNIDVYCAVPEQIPTGTFPDEWYQGVVSFGDAIWKINVENEVSERILVLSTSSGQAIDAVDLAFGPSESMLFFVNKNDGTPWRLLFENNFDSGQGVSAVSPLGM